MAEYNKADLMRRMDGAIESLKADYTGLRTGRASVNLMDPVQVDAYGAKTPLNQLANIAAPEARLLTVQVWDAALVKAVEKGIMDAGLGLNPQPEGNLIRIPIPDLNEERRAEITKVAGKYAENARIAVRNVRRDGMDAIKKSEESDDVQKRQSDEVQKLTDEKIQIIDMMLSDKEKDIMTI